MANKFFQKNNRSMKNTRLMLLLAVFLTGCAPSSGEEAVEIKKYPAFPSKYVQPRNVEVMLPPGYDPRRKYDVLYMHDGQNVFEASTAFSGVEWQMDETAAGLIKEKRIRPVIIVASWCTEKRFSEYMPGKPGNEIMELLKKDTAGRKIISDAYLKFLVYELKPFIDKSFSTYGTPEHTWIMGSSMGGLISCYAVCEYPKIFGGAACLSTHWPAMNGVFLHYLGEQLPDPRDHRFYFDYGTLALDSLYEPYQLQADSILISKGYLKDKNWMTRKFAGASHNEKSWQERVNIPLQFLLGGDDMNKEPRTMQ
jgi:predicted alpha/beta superfamily hydrolase